MNKYEKLRAEFLSNCRNEYGEPCGGDTSVGVFPCPYWQSADVDGKTGKPIPAGCLLKAERDGGAVINKDFYGLTPEEYDKTIAGLSFLSLIVAPFIMQSKQGGIEQAAEFSLDMQIAADAVKELKQQIHGAEDKL